jgi:3',5'-cyclic-AMP phosphodiesterase
VVITSPSDERLLTKSSEIPQGTLRVRTKFRGEVEAAPATVPLDGYDIQMERIKESQIWETNATTRREGVHSSVLSVRDECGNVATDEIRVLSDDLSERERFERDQDNVLEVWLKHRLLGTQLGPDRNGKKW